MTWTRLASTATAGSTTLTLQQAVDWEVGDKIVIATTGHRHSQEETETRYSRHKTTCYCKFLIKHEELISM